ncbi:MAG: hypothetical protein COA43_01040 [Robiginitomaculum sp.]|nr:MAG: hypothetical protein COA43_01040 [Robiginitomaculum sp.]
MDSDAKQADRHARIFDRGTIGVQTSPIVIEIERGRVASFAQSIAETNPIYLDKSAAQAAGYPDVVAPVTFPIVINMLANEMLAKRGEKALFQLIKADFRRLLHGEERYDYSGLIYVGDTVIVSGSVVGFEDKKGGQMELATLRTTISHKERGDLVSMTSTAIHRLA